MYIFIWPLYSQGMDEVEVGASLLEGTGADALRWRTQNCRPELESIKCVLYTSLYTSNIPLFRCSMTKSN